MRRKWETILRKIEKIRKIALTWLKSSFEESKRRNDFKCKERNGRGRKEIVHKNERTLKIWILKSLKRIWELICKWQFS